MNNEFDFDKVPSRKNTFSLKWDVQDGELPMWVADMDFETAPCVKSALIHRAEHGVFGYSIIPDAFFHSIQKWWKRRHHVQFKKEWMIYSSGVVAAISSMVRRLTMTGDSVLIQSPVYNIFYNSILNNGCHVLSSDLIYANGEYHIDFDDLERKLSLERTTLMILCNPHNPVGKIWSKEELTKIVLLCKKYHVTIISDEIHCDICDPGKEYHPLLSIKESKEISITCIAASKAFNLAGLQSACVIVPNQELRRKVNRGLNADEVAEPNAFSMIGNIAAFEEGEPWLNALNQYLYENKKWVSAYIKENLPHLYLVPSEATYLLWVDISYYSHHSKDFAESLRKATGLFVSEGEEYGESGKDFIRINIATTLENVKEGMRRLSNYVKENF